ncbi:MAG: hypothetical protein K8H90_09150 [Thermoanaerobaculia bacterium]|nr:hypothetical protein [Thermoanaerobaculia bacterium]
MSCESTTPNLPVRREGERGSAYLFALFALLVLSVIGLSLALVTQTEVQISGAERQATRVFYGADSGLRIQLANHLVNGDVEAHTRAHGNPLVLDQRTILGSQMSELIEVSPFYPIFSGVCNLCMVNQDAGYFAVNHALTSTALRIGVIGSTETEQARKMVAQMFALQPWEQTIAALQQAGDLSTIKY